MGRLIGILINMAALLASGMIHAQERQVSVPEDLYRPIYGYVIDTCTNKPVTEVQVYGFESMEDALRGRKAIDEGRNPLRISLKGDIVVAGVDAAGRYMIPAVSKGVLLFHFKESGRMLFEEVDGRTEVSLGRKVEEEEFHLDLDAYSLEGKVPRRKRGSVPAEVKVDMDFNCHFPPQGTDASDSRVFVERHIVDIETGETLSVTVPVARDGRSYHRKAQKLAARTGIPDTLGTVAERLPYLNDTTRIIRVKDPVDAGRWKDRCFRLAYVVRLAAGGEVRSLDTLYMMTNRVGRPLKFLEYAFEPYGMGPGEDEGRRLPVRRRVVLKGEFDGKVPDVLLDDAYELTGIHIKATAAPLKTYREDMALADSCMQAAADAVKAHFGQKIDDDVRVIRTTEVMRWTDVADALAGMGEDEASAAVRSAAKRHSGDPDAQTKAVAGLECYGTTVLPYLRTCAKVEYRYDLLTSRHFSRNEYLEAFSKAGGAALDSLCRMALEESEMLEGEPWVYAANLMASRRLEDGKPDCTILEPFVNPMLDEDDCLGLPELAANQVVMLISAGKPSEASTLAKVLPDEYMYLREIAACKAGGVPSSEEAVRSIAASSLRNSVVMDMYSGSVDEDTLEEVCGLPEEDALTWYLRARCLCMLYGNDMSDMTTLEYASTGQTVYGYVKDCLAGCFAADPEFRKVAVLDGDINEYALKEVLGVFVL